MAFLCENLGCHLLDHGVQREIRVSALLVRQLTDDFQATLNTPEIKTKLTQAGFEVIASDGPALDRHLRDEYERWGKFVRETKLKLED